MIKPSQTGKVVGAINRRLGNISLLKSVKYNKAPSTKINADIRKLMNRKQDLQDAKNMLVDRNALQTLGGTKILRRFAKIKGIGR